MKRLVIKRSRLPVNLNASQMVTVWLLLEHLGAAHGWYVAFWITCGLTFAGWVACLFIQEETEPMFDQSERVFKRVAELVKAQRNGP